MYKKNNLINNINGDKMKVEEIMTKNVVIADKSESIHHIAAMMKKYDIGFIPIRDEKKIIGVVTDRDIACTIVANNCDIDNKIESYINRSIKSIEKDETTMEALSIMSENKIKRLLVTDKKRIVGVLSISDIINGDSKNPEIISTLKRIWTITHTSNKFEAEIDEFYL